MCKAYAVFEGGEVSSLIPFVDDNKKPAMPRSAPTIINDSFGAITRDGADNCQAQASALVSILNERAGRPLYLASVDPVILPMMRKIDPRCQSFVFNWETNPRLNLPNDWETFLGGLTAKQRAQFRRFIRLGETEGMEFQFLEEADDVATATRRSLEQRRQVWSDHKLFEEASDFQQRPEWDDFLVEVAHSLATSGMAVCGQLEYEGRVVAACLMHRRHDRLLGYHRTAERTQMSLGAIFDAFSIKDAIERGVSVFEFGRGAEDYKYQRGAVDVALCDVVVGHANVAALMVMALRVVPELVRGHFRTKRH